MKTLEAVATLMRKSRGLNYQTRWNMYPKTRPESIAEHTFNVALFTLAILVIKNNGNISLTDCEAVVGSLLHDIEEAVTGDIPTLTKRSMGNEIGMLLEAKKELCLNEVPTFEYMFKFFRNNRIVELADKLAALWFAAEQESCGVKLYTHIKNQIATQIVGEYSEVFPQIKEFLSSLGITYERENYTMKFTHVGEYYADKKSGSADSCSGTMDGQNVKSTGEKKV